MDEKAEQHRRLCWATIDPHPTLSDEAALEHCTPAYKDRLVELMHGKSATTGKIVRADCTAEALRYVSYCIDNRAHGVLVLVAATTIDAAAAGCSDLEAMYPSRRWHLMPTSYEELWAVAAVLPQLGIDTLPEFGAKGANAQISQFCAKHRDAFRPTAPLGTIDTVRPLVAVHQLGGDAPEAAAIYVTRWHHLIMVDSPAHDHHYHALMLVPVVRRWALLADQVAWAAYPATVMTAGCGAPTYTWERCRPLPAQLDRQRSSETFEGLETYDFRSPQAPPPAPASTRKRPRTYDTSRRSSTARICAAVAEHAHAHTHSVVLFTHPDYSWYANYGRLCVLHFAVASSSGAVQARDSYTLQLFATHAIDNRRLRQAMVYITNRPKEFRGKRVLFITSCARLAKLTEKALKEAALKGVRMDAATAVACSNFTTLTARASTRYRDYECVVLLDPWALGRRPARWLCCTFTGQTHFVWVLAQYTPEVAFQHALVQSHMIEAGGYTTERRQVEVTPENLFRNVAAGFVPDTAVIRHAIGLRRSDRSLAARVLNHELAAFQDVRYMEEAASCTSALAYALMDKRSRKPLSAWRRLPTSVYVEVMAAVTAGIQELCATARQAEIALSHKLNALNAEYVGVGAGKFAAAHFSRARNARIRAARKKNTRAAELRAQYTAMTDELYRLRTYQPTSKETSEHLAYLVLARRSPAAVSGGTGRVECLPLELDITWRVCVDSHIGTPAFVAGAQRQHDYAGMLDAGDGKLNELALACSYFSYAAQYEPRKVSAAAAGYSLSLMLDENIMLGAHPVRQGVIRAHDHLRGAESGLLSLQCVPNDCLQAWSEVLHGRMSTSAGLPDWLQVTEYSEWGDGAGGDGGGGQ